MTAHALVLALAALGLGGCSRSDPPKPAPAATDPSAARMVSAARSAVAAAATRCGGLEWTGEPKTAKAVALGGRLSVVGSGPDKRFVVALRAPVCAADGSTQKEIEVIPTPSSPAEDARITTLLGKDVRVSGTAEEPEEKRDRPGIVVRGAIDASP